MVDTRQESKRRSGSFPISSTSSKKKLAPRSSLQFKIGPQFTPTVIKSKIVNSMGIEVTPLLNPRIDRGFERIDGEWVGYKRNYFTLVGTFQFPGILFDEFSRDQYYVLDPSSNSRIKIKYFGLRLVSRSAEDGVTVNLIQHTAKRDRGPQFTPPIQPAIPSELPNHDVIREAANIRNTSKIAKLNSIFVYQRGLHDKENYKSNTENLLRYPNDVIVKVARYERIQFASSINYKKPSPNNKRLKLYMELVGFTSKSDFVTLAYSETPPLIVRGRSPSNYTEFNEKAHNRSSTELKSTKVSELPSPANPNELVFEKNSSPDDLGDIETYDILKAATNVLDGLSPNGSLKDKKKPKRGRKPKDNKPPKITKRKVAKSPKKKVSNEKEKLNVLREICSNTPISTDEKMNSDFIKLENFLNLNFDENMLLEDMDTQEFNESFFDIKGLEESSSRNLFQGDVNSPRLSVEEYNLFDSYDMEIEMMKERADSIEKTKNELLETFMHVHENPSFGLELAGFEDVTEFLMGN